MPENNSEIAKLEIKAILEQVDAYKVEGPANLSAREIEQLTSLISIPENNKVITTEREKLIVPVKDRIILHIEDGLRAGKTPIEVSKTLLAQAILTYHKEQQEPMDQITNSKRQEREWYLLLHVMDVKECFKIGMQRARGSDGVDKAIKALEEQKKKPIMELFVEDLA